MSNLLENLLNIDGALVYLLVGVLVFSEDALFVGFVVPGETAAILGGVDASRGHVHLSAMMGVVVVAAVVGDTVGYEVGRHLGSRLVDHRSLRRHHDRLEGAQRLLAVRGGSAVFLGRFIAFFRAVMPALAGTARMRYPRFLAFNAAGGVVWGVGVVLLGFLAGSSYKTVEKYLGRGAAVLFATVTVAALTFWVVRRRRAERQREGQRDTE